MPGSIGTSEIREAVPLAVRQARPTVWLNPRRVAADDILPTLTLTRADVEAAEARWRRFDPLLAHLFDALGTGRIDSPFRALAAPMARRVAGGQGGAVWVKADHELPVTGCIKARGGVYEVLVYAEALALAQGLLRPGETYARLADPDARRLFGAHTVAVGSTGNLGFSVGVMARALGFRVEVHMSHDAKAWKKQRLREIGAEVVEHAGDYGSAVAAARAAFADRADAHFVDDEDSLDLFLGYATAAFDLRRQLAAAGVAVDRDHPLYVYLPCGVGSAPGGVSFGLTLLFGDAVRCIFVEPVAAPCMLVQLAAGLERPVSVYEVGLDNRTEADGLAVASASMRVARTVGPLIEAVVTVSDADLSAWLRELWTGAGLRLEPSAAAGFAAVRPFLAALPAPPGGDRATHVVWTTGGALLPEAEFQAALRGDGTG
ncbi:D-serine ammonia-lyase [Methylobacterium planeticum]|uniref:Probable D-serine dehydratase n=1 Tax=Methylobacterium planeticum TaxID=2615211 RepID=A0A6N6MX04_9HYPH|nr:D-serine ammonia-lyase [Methylobacterium planeticum]KAB1074420.1 D-serine ammonia-lyase [Methylobacterium planeticum]